MLARRKTLKWGQIPCWAKDTKIAYGTANARAKTVARNPAKQCGTAS